MRLLLIGLLVGGAGGLLIQKFVLDPPEGRSRVLRTTEAAAPAKGAAAGADVASLVARIKELEAALAAASAPPGEEPFELEVPTTDEGIDLLMEEFQRTDDLDRLLALIRALLRKGEKGYPRLTTLLMRVIGKAMAQKFKEEDLLQRVIPALKLAMRHEKELVGYVGYLMTADGVPGMMRTGAVGAAMFLSVNGGPGSDAFSGKLLEQFLASSAGKGGRGLFGGDGEQRQMLIQAMGMLRQKEAVEPLLRMLADPAQQENAWSIVNALGKIGDPRAVAPLIARLREMNDDESNWWSPELTALAELGTPDAILAAEEHLAGLSDNSRFFSQAGNLLRAYPSAKVVGMMRDRFRAQPGNQNLWNALWGLRQAATPEATALLEEIATTAGEEQMREQARSYLEERKRMAEEIAESER